MKPVSYQWMPSAVNSGHLPFDGVLAIPNVVHCERPAYNPHNTSGFRKNLEGHTGIRFYNNRILLGEAELNTHVKQAAKKYPFSCPYCGQGYMRRLCLVKHIDRLHENGGTSGNVKPGLMAKTPQVPVSSAFPTLSTADPSPLRPVVRVTVPTSSTSFQLSKGEHKDKTLDANASHVANSNATLLPPLNGQIHHNRALTVSLPNEVSIPAGCLVELVEVKTVNGMKELKLRLISKEENESVIKDTGTTALHDMTQEKQSSFMLPSANMAKSVSFEPCVINRTLNEASARSVEHRPAVLPVRHQLNQTNDIKVGLKRSSPGTISLDCSNVPPNKLPRSLSPLQRNSGINVSQRETVNHGTPTSIMVPMVVVSKSIDSQSQQNLDTCVSRSTVDEGRNQLHEQTSIILPRLSGNKSIPSDIPVPLESRNSHLNGNGTLSSVCLPAPRQRRTPPVLVPRNNPINQRFLLPKILNRPASFQALSDCIKPKKSIQKRKVKSDEKERELVTKDVKSFPVISSVFSLSQQPGDVQGPHQPLVMALRGIVMDEGESPASTTEDHVASNDSRRQGKEMQLPENSARVDSKPEPTDVGFLSTNTVCESVKIEDSHKATQYESPSNHSCVKKEKDDPADPTDIDKCAPTSDTKPLKDNKFVSNTVTNVISSAKAEAKVEGNSLNVVSISSKFLTVSLKRVQVGKKYEGQSLEASKPKQQVCMDNLDKYSVLHLLPLSVDQMVKRPGPNQPVVVLNHPKPRASAHRAGADASAHTGTSEAVPKCQILKMRLSKVMGQKYEVKGCTVGVSQ